MKQCVSAIVKSMDDHPDEWRFTDTRARHKSGVELCTLFGITGLREPEMKVGVVGAWRIRRAVRRAVWRQALVKLESNHPAPGEGAR